MLLGVLAAFSISVKAQDFPSSYGTLGVSYHPMNIVTTEANEKESATLNGVSLSWTNANALSTVVPLYIQYGLTAQYSFRSDYSKSVAFLYSSSMKLHFLSFKAPVELTYRFLIPGSKFYVAPYTGVDVVVYALGRRTTSYSDEITTESSTIDVFTNAAEYGDKLNRFNLDWHAGMKLFFNKFFVGGAYEGPIVGFYKKDQVKMNTNQVNICLGFVF